MSVIAVDTETTGLDFVLGAEPFMVTACDNEGNLFYWEFEVDPLTKKVIRDKRTIKDLTDTLVEYDRWVFHNANFDIRALATLLGCSYEEIKQYHKNPTKFWDCIDDTLLMSHILDNQGSHGLKALAVRYLDIPSDDEQDLKDSVIAARRFVRSLHRRGVIPDWAIHGDTAQDYWLPSLLYKTFPNEAQASWKDVCLTYALRDVERTMGLYMLFLELLSSRKLEGVYLNHLEVLRPVIRIENRGMNFLMGRATSALREIKEQIDTLSQEIKEIAKRFGSPEDLNLESPKQLCSLVYDQMKLPVVSVTASGSPSIDAGTITELLNEFDVESEDPRLEFLLKLKELRMASTSSKYIRNYLGYAVPNQKNKRVLYSLFPNLNNTGTKTTRFSCSNPNGQNISTGHEEEDEEGHKIKRFNLRELFGPPPGYVWYAIDYSSLQLIIFAYEANDAGMIESFAKGYDFHNYVACGLFNTKEPTKNERRIAKNVNYALIFGAGAKKVDTTAGMEGAYELYQNQFPIVAQYMEQISYQVRKKGCVYTAFNYPLQVPREQPYKGVNYIVQGDEGDIVKRAMILCDDFLSIHPSQSKLIMQIHDELVFQCPIGKEFPLKRICNLMMSPARNLGWVTPVGASLVTKHWGDKQDLEVEL